ncbi:hypothetical protein NPIL_329111 [Nephila pilipes]|uniref:Uncharacterized protein n=1 Tax=Nephila pilipes TaxID=299642 RepID=A0A8X6Q8H8_NEPPI|nr:hypothetical protein NPIL_329111 [Nephila pilipes]
MAAGVLCIAWSVVCRSLSVSGSSGGRVRDLSKRRTTWRTCVIAWVQTGKIALLRAASRRGRFFTVRISRHMPCSRGVPLRSTDSAAAYLLGGSSCVPGVFLLLWVQHWRNGRCASLRALYMRRLPSPDLFSNALRFFFLLALLLVSFIVQFQFFQLSAGTTAYLQLTAVAL